MEEERKHYNSVMEGINTSLMDGEVYHNLMMEERSIINHDGWENIGKEIIVELVKRMWVDIENEIVTNICKCLCVKLPENPNLFELILFNPAGIQAP